MKINNQTKVAIKITTKFVTAIVKMERCYRYRQKNNNRYQKSNSNSNGVTKNALLPNPDNNMLNLFAHRFIEKRYVLSSTCLAICLAKKNDWNARAFVII